MSTRLRALTHIGLLTDDVERTASRWQELFGFGRVGRRPTWHATEERLLSTVLTFPGGVMEPLQPTADGPHRAEYVRGRRAYHVSIQVDGIRETVDELRDRGVWVQLRPPGEVLNLHRGWLDPESTSGLVVEMTDTAEIAGFVSAEELAALTGGGGVAEAQPVVTGWDALGLVVHDIERTSRIFRDTLGFRVDWEKPVEVLEEGVRMQRFRLPAGPAVEAVEPLDGFGSAAAHLAAVGEGVGYLSMTVSDLDRTTARLSDQEVWLRRAPAGPNLPRRTWVHARSTDGIAVVLTESAANL